MKISNLIATFIISGLLTFSVNTANAQNDKTSKQQEVSNWVNNKDFYFLAQRALPLTGQMKYLTSEYTLDIYPDSVISFLPYYGRAYSAPVNLSDGGIKFTSTNFDYTISGRKKSRWDITIKPKDVSGVNELRLTIFSNGSASLDVTSNNRQQISFNGIIKHKEPKS